MEAAVMVLMIIVLLNLILRCDLCSVCNILQTSPGNMGLNKNWNLFLLSEADI